VGARFRVRVLLYGYLRVAAWARAVDDALAAAEAALGPTDGEVFARTRRELRGAVQRRSSSSGG
jgi:hypothetical protein